MPLSREQVKRLQRLLKEEVDAEEKCNPTLDCELVRQWLYQQLDHLEIQGWPASAAPPLEPKAGADQQDEMDALDGIWRRAIARMD